MPEPQYKHVPNLALGYNPSVPPDLLQDGESPYVKNLIFDEGLVKTDTGYQTFGSTIEGYPQKIFQLVKKAGTSVFLLITTSTLYKWATPEWQFVSNSNATQASGEHTATDWITVDNTASFRVSYPAPHSSSAWIGVMLESGLQHQTKLNAVSAGHWLQMDTTLASGATVSDNAAVIEAVPLAGDLDDPVSCAPWVPDDDLIFTNNKDEPQLYDSSADECKNIQNLPESGVFLAAVVRIFNNYVCFYNTTEAGNPYPQRVRRCNTADPTNWATGNAGYNDLWDEEDHITAVEPIGPYMAVYREKAIYRQSYVGSTSVLFNFEEMVSGEGAIGIEAVAVLKDFHLVLGNTSIFRYDGGMSLIDIGKKVKDYILGRGGRLNPEYKHRALAFQVEELDEAWFLIPTGDESLLGFLIRVKTDKEVWAIREFYHDFIGYGLYKNPLARTWNDLTGSWIEQVWSWDDRRLSVGSSSIMLCGHTPKQVYEYDFVTIADNTQTIVWEFQTKDFSSARFKLRMNLLDIYANGATVEISRSHDRGSSWTSIETVTLNESLALYNIWSQFLNRMTRYKLSGQGGGFALEWLGIEFSEESDW